MPANPLKRGPNSSDVLAEAEHVCTQLTAQSAALDQLHAHLDEQAATLGALAAEAEHICSQVGAGLAVLERVTTELQWLRHTAERTDGRLERLELWVAEHDPSYPRTQLAALPEARARVAEGEATW